MRNQVLLLSRNRDAVLPFLSGISLHSHTRHSHESLGFIGKFLYGHPSLRGWIKHKSEYCRHASGIVVDFDRAYWTPPLCERMAYAVELQQIEALGLRPMVSLSDHNSIQACTLLRATPEFRDTPISTEWTVPFGRTIFHIGVHNMPAELAESLMAEMALATAAADERRIVALLAELCRLPSVLVIFNHPLWNFEGISSELFHCELARFLESAAPSIHAFELNGMRNHRENRAVIKLAAEWDQVLISGGDRHGGEPNAWLNLTNAADFAEFVDEIRNGKQSTVLIMPQYGEPLGWRLYQNFTHVIADYPGHPEGRRRWDERTFHPDQSGAIVPMIDLWHVGPPKFLKTIFAAALMAGNVPVRGLLRRWMARENESLMLPQAKASQKLPGAGEGSRHVSSEDGAGETCLDDCLCAQGEPAAD